MPVKGANVKVFVDIIGMPMTRSPLRVSHGAAIGERTSVDV